MPTVAFDFMTGALPAGATLARASLGWSYNAAGVLTQAAINTARFDYNPGTLALRGLLNEPALTNNIRNSSAVGGSSGSQPTNWNIAGNSDGLTRTLVGIGTEDGIPYYELRYAGTATANNSRSIAFEPNTQIAALEGQPWTVAMTARLIGTPVGANVNVNLTPRDAGGGNISGAGLNFPVTVTGARLASQTISVSGNLVGPTTAFVRGVLLLVYTIGQVIDVTIRVGNPQITPGLVPMSPIPTTTVAVTRAADLLTVPLLNGTYDITVNRLAGPTTYLSQVVTTGSWPVPTDPSPLQSVQATLLSATLDFTGGTLPAGATLARASVANYVNNTGVLTQAAIDAARFTHDPLSLVLQGLLNEPSDTNTIPNASCIGTTNGSPGNTPTGWSVTSTANGVTRTVVGSGTEDGIPYFDLRYAGTPSTSGNMAIRHTTTTGNPALPDSVWSATCFCRLMAGALPSTLNYQICGTDGGGSVLVSPGATITPTGAALRTQRFANNAAVLANAGVANVHSRFQLAYVSGVPADVTLRIGLPQLVQGPVVSSPITTTTVALTRSPDVLTIPVPDGIYDVTIERLDGTTNLPGETVAGGYVVPNSLSPVRSVTLAAVAVVVDGKIATPVVIVVGQPVFAGPATPRLMVTAGEVYDGPATPIQIVVGRPVLPGPATPMRVVTGRPTLPGKATPVL